MATQILCSESRHTLNHAMLKSIFKTHVTHLHYYNLTFSIECQDLWVQLDARRWIAVGPGEGGR